MPIHAPPRRLTPERQALASDPRHLRLAEGIAAKFGRRFPPLADEFESAAPVALCEAAATFDPEAGANFVAHAAARLEGAMRDTCRNWTAKGYRRQSEDAPLTGSISGAIGHDDEGEAITLDGAIAADEEPVGWEAEYQDEVEGLSRRLPAGMRAAFRSLYSRADLITMKAAGRAAGLSESRVGQIHTQAGECLAERFHDPKEIFMSGRASRFLTPTRIGAASIHPAGGDATPEPCPGGRDNDPGPVPDAANGACPDCRKPYGKHRRCYACNPKAAGPARPDGRAKVAHLPSPGAPDLASASPANTPPVAAERTRDTDARRELRAMGEILSIAEKLGPGAARRVLAWVADHVNAAV